MVTRNIIFFLTNVTFIDNLQTNVLPIKLTPFAKGGGKRRVLGKFQHGRAAEGGTFGSFVFD